MLLNWFLLPEKPHTGPGKAKDPPGAAYRRRGRRGGPPGEQKGGDVLHLFFSAPPNQKNEKE